MIGEKLGPYEIIEKIGSGGMATVYLAYQHGINRHVAVKVIHGYSARDKEEVARFQHEAQLIASLEHVHILPVYDFDGAHIPPYIVMRYLEGGTLKAVMEQKQLPLEQIAYLLEQLGSALDYAHRQGVVHRDIKPANIMIDREGNAFITDFGIARLTGQDRQSDHDRTLITNSPIVGTPAYMSPEQAQVLPDIDHRSDIYSLAVMLFEMLTGQWPFQAKSPMMIMIHHVKKPAPGIRDIIPEFSETLDEALRHAMEKAPDNRPQSATDFVKQVLDAIRLQRTVPQLSNKLSTTDSGAFTATQTLPAASPLDEKLKTTTDTMQVILHQLDKRSLVSQESQTNIALTPEKIASPSPSENNVPVTVLYVDAAEYAAIIEEEERRDIAQQAITDLWQSCEQIAHSLDGQVMTRTGNSLLMAWGLDNPADDDLQQAIRAALKIHKKADSSLPLAIGIHTGMASATRIKGIGDSISGKVVNRAQRLTRQANLTGSGEILITEAVYRCVQGIFTVIPAAPLRGRTASIPVYRIIASEH